VYSQIAIVWQSLADVARALKIPANAGLCGAVGRSTLLASRLLILRLTSRNPHGMGTSSPSASVSIAAAPRCGEWKDDDFDLLADDTAHIA